MDDVVLEQMIEEVNRRPGVVALALEQRACEAAQDRAHLRPPSGGPFSSTARSPGVHRWPVSSIARASTRSTRL